MRTLCQVQFPFQNRHQQITADGRPKPALRRVVTPAWKTPDSQVLLDPFEEQFHLPAPFAKPGRGPAERSSVNRQAGFSCLPCAPPGAAACTLAHHTGAGQNSTGNVIPVVFENEKHQCHNPIGTAESGNRMFHRHCRRRIFTRQNLSPCFSPRQ